MDAEVQAAVIAVRSVIETNPYDAIEAGRTLQRLAILVPPHIAPMAHKAGQVIEKSIEHPGGGYDSLARSRGRPEGRPSLGRCLKSVI